MPNALNAGVSEENYDYHDLIKNYKIQLVNGNENYIKLNDIDFNESFL